MSLKTDLEAYAKKTHDDVWKRRVGQKVPEDTDVTLGTDAVDLDATILYADLSDSTGLVKGYKNWFAAEVYKNYVYTAGKIVRAQGGSITAYDGDRVMAVFIGDNKNTSAAKCALQINWAVINILQAALDMRYPDSTYKLRQKIGIDASKVMVAKTGIRGNNDLVWIGNAANNAAKMATLNSGYQTYISSEVYERLADEAKYGGEPKRDMWTALGSSSLGYPIYGSTYSWSIA